MVAVMLIFSLAGSAGDAQNFTDIFFFFQAEDGIRDFHVTWSSDVCSSDLSERSIGSQNSIRHFDGSGTRPSGPRAGNVGVIGTNGAPIRRASTRLSASLG